MPHIDDCKFEALIGYDGALPDKLLAYYQAFGATALDLQDAEEEYLLALGATLAPIQDMWMELFTSWGYTGALMDMHNAFWCDGAPIPIIVGALDIFVNVGVSFGCTTSDLSVVSGNFRTEGFVNAANNDDFTVLTAVTLLLTPTVATALVAEVAGATVNIYLLP